MADSGSPALFEDEPTPQTNTEEPSSDLFGETTEISLDAEEKKESEPAKVDVESTEKDESEEASPEKSEDEHRAAASVDVTNLSEPKEAPKKEEKPKPKPEVKCCLERTYIYFLMLQ
jgi:hypothetical protein